MDFDVEAAFKKYQLLAAAAAAKKETMHGELLSALGKKGKQDKLQP